MSLLKTITNQVLDISETNFRLKTYFIKIRDRRLFHYTLGGCYYEILFNTTERKLFKRKDPNMSWLLDNDMLEKVCSYCYEKSDKIVFISSHRIYPYFNVNKQIGLKYYSIWRNGEPSVYKKRLR